jgi:16S rRNA processing protein RimM
LIFLGKIIKVRGIRGELVLAPSPNFEKLIPQSGEVIDVHSKKYKRQMTVEYIKEVGGLTVLKLQDSHSINDAYKLIGYSIFSHSSEVIEDDSIIQFKVKDKQGNVWGIVKNIEQAGISELLEVEDPGGDLIYVPFSEGIVKHIDTDAEEIIIDAPPGLKDLNK